MSAAEIIQVIDVIPGYITYIYPGYLTIYIYLFFRAKSLLDSKAVFFKAIGISFIYIQFLELFHIRNPFAFNLILIAISVGIAYIAYLFVKSETVSKILKIFEIETTYWDNEIEALQGFDHGAWIVIYLNNDDVVYEGYIDFKELEEGKRQYICLSQYRKYQLEKDGRPKKPYLEEHDSEIDEKVVVFYKDIKRIEKRATT